MWIDEPYDVTALGELLVDFTDCGRSADGMRVFEQNPGGAPANVLCALAGFGMKTAFIGKVGQDAQGDFLRGVLREKGVDTTGLIRDPSVFTTLAFVTLSASGERGFSFARKPGADAELSPDELNTEILERTRVFHFGSLSLTREPARSATLRALEVAKGAGALVSYDPNYRAPLWDSREEAAAGMRGVLGLADMVKLSAEETALLTGREEPAAAALELLRAGADVAVVTLGKNGALVRTREGWDVVQAPNCPVVDTTGAGDAFWAGFLYKLLESGLSPGELPLKTAKSCALFGNLTACLCIQKRGAVPAMPNLERVRALSRRYGPF